MFSYRKTQTQHSFFASRKKPGNFRSYINLKEETAKKAKKVPQDKTLSHCVSPRKSMITSKTIDLSKQKPKKTNSQGNFGVNPRKLRNTKSPARGVGLESGIYTVKKFIATSKQWDSISSSEKSVMIKDEPSLMSSNSHEIKLNAPFTPSIPENTQKRAILLSKLHEEEAKYKRLEDKYKKLLSNYKRSEKEFENELNIIYRQRKLMNIKDDEVDASELAELDSYVAQLKEILKLAENKAQKLCRSISNS